MTDRRITLDQEQLDQLCNTLIQALEHVMGPSKEPDSVACGIHRIADALESIAEALRERG